MVSPLLVDHLTVTAPSLEAGAAFVRNALGVSPQAGGEHPRMGTHNLLLRLGDSLFLEVIAPNPSVPAPPRPRWFALDTLGPRSQPSLSTWVVRTTDIRATLSSASEALGNIEPMNRGALEWLISIPSDGSLPLGGVGPTLIEWHTDSHPAAGLEDRGLSLAGFELLHPDPERVSRLLQSLEIDAPVSVSALPGASTPRLVAHIETPHGLRSLPVLQPIASADRQNAAPPR